MAFEKIKDDERESLEKLLYKSIIEEYRKNKISEGYYQYEVVLQKTKFLTDLTDQELKDTVRLEKDLKEVGADSSKRWELMQVLNIWQIFATEQIQKIIVEVDKAQRVGGAWALLIANPKLKSAILSVYQIIVDDFDNPQLYYHSTDFLTRAMMNMHGQACDED